MLHIELFHVNLYSTRRKHQVYTVKYVVCYVTLWSANHTVMRVVNTTQYNMIHQLVWYAYFIFTVYAQHTYYSTYISVP